MQMRLMIADKRMDSIESPQDPLTNILLSIFSLKIETGSLKFMHNAKKHIQNPFIEGGEGGGKGMG